MELADSILERWFADCVAVYPSQTALFVTTEDDRFRNPVGHLMRDSLLCIIEEILGNMEQSRLRPAMEAIIRIRGVQNMTAAEAVGFVFPLRRLLAEVLPESGRDQMTDRIDKLALLAFEEYLLCRERISELRLHEGARASAVTAAMARRRD